MGFILLLPFLISSKLCKDLDQWLLNCDFPNENLNYSTIICPQTGFYEYNCSAISGIVCDGDQIIKKSILCYPSEGKDPSTALWLSVIFGFLGIDRFYLGYPTIGLFKLFTGGFFGLGWYIDIYLIALRILKPARNGTYMFKPNSNFRIRLPGDVWI